MTGRRLAERWALVRRAFVAGVVILLPAALTLYILWLLFWISTALFTRPVAALVQPLIGGQVGPATSATISAVITVGLVIGAGLAAQRLGRAALRRLEERLFSRLPVARGIHRAVRQLFDLFDGDGAAHRGVALVEYPRRGMFAICFITAREPWRVEGPPDQELMSVYLPTTPNPTSGFLLLVPRSEILAIDLSVEDAARIIMSGGSLPVAERRLRAHPSAGGPKPEGRSPGDGRCRLEGRSDPRARATDLL